MTRCYLTDSHQIWCVNIFSFWLRKFLNTQFQKGCCMYQNQITLWMISMEAVKGYNTIGFLQTLSIFFFVFVFGFAAYFMLCWYYLFQSICKQYSTNNKKHARQPLEIAVSSLLVHIMNLPKTCSWFLCWKMLCWFLPILLMTHLCSHVSGQR